MRDLILYSLLFATAALAADSSSSCVPPLNNLPQCAQLAALSAITASGCGTTDVECICKSSPFISTLRAYITSQCSASDAQAALIYGEKTCSCVGVPFVVPSDGVSVPTTTTVAGEGTVTSTTETATSTPETSISISSEMDVASASSMMMTTTWSTMSDSTTTSMMPTTTTMMMTTASGNMTVYTGGAAEAVGGRQGVAAVAAGVAGLAAVLF